MSALPSIGAVRTGCGCCPPKPETAPMDWYPHPGFGMLDLTRDGETDEAWATFTSWPTESVCWGSWQDGTIKAGPNKGKPWHAWIGGTEYPRLEEAVTLSDIEEAVADDPDHDWRLEIHGPMGGVVYQRQGCAQWVAVKRLEGFA